jgi:hypothetical protein
MARTKSSEAPLRWVSTVAGAVPAIGVGIESGEITHMFFGARLGLSFWTVAGIGDSRALVRFWRTLELMCRHLGH